jgi:hypothetical protein
LFYFIELTLPENCGMDIYQRIDSFGFLGDHLRRYHENSNEPDILSLIEAARLAYAENTWFTPENIRIALNNLGEELNSENLTAWISGYHHQFQKPFIQKTIGVVMAGNIPAVGFHDFMCVLVAGHKIKARLSTTDARLLPAMAEILTGHMPEWKEQIIFTTGKLEHFDAIIATGSDNTSRYFEYYFGKYPHIIRKNRNSIAIITGDESKSDLEKLADDIMHFFGMGCRSVSKVYVPEGYDFSLLVSALEKYEQCGNHNKYRNNYDYCKSIFMVNQVPVIDTGFLLFKEDQSVRSRIAVLHYERYSRISDVLAAVKINRNMIQCIVSKSPLPLKYTLPGNAQHPELWDYADEVDTLGFLLS